MKNKKAIIGLGAIATLLFGVATSIAYLTDTDTTVNVMTVGNVKIAQLEYERVVDENGNWIESEYENYGYKADLMQPYTQNKPASPAVYKNDKKTMIWDDRNEPNGDHQQPWKQIGADGSNELFDDSVKNVVDKFVFVKNTGKKDAYYRTIIAVEAPEGLSSGTIHFNFNSNSRFDYNVDEEGIQNSSNSNKFYTIINGTRYLVYVATYTQVLEPNEVSRPSLLQVYLDPKTTNEDIELFGDTWEILAFSQAVQTDGFSNAYEALEEAFGKVTSTNHPWVDGFEMPRFVSTENELAAALQEGGNVVLESDVELSEKLVVAMNTTTTLDLNGHTISRNSAVAGTDALLENKGDLEIKNGTLSYESSKPDAAFGYGTNTITNSGKLEITEATIINSTNGGSSNAIDNAPGSTLVVNSGKIESKKITIRVRKTAKVTINRGVISGSRALQLHLFENRTEETSVTINGGTFTSTTAEKIAIYSLANGVPFGDTKVTINGGTFNGDVLFGGGDKTTKETVTINGGTFNGDYLGRYLANDDWEDIAKPY